MTPNDQRPDIPYSCRLAADSAQARLDPLNSQPLVPQIRVARRATRSFTAGLWPGIGARYCGSQP
jgi:hypothetical protein